MNYGEIRTQFKNILNRRDCTNALADTFLNQALQRCSRELRLTGQETTTAVTVSTPFSGFPVPSGILAVIAMMGQATSGQERKLTQLPLARFLEIDNNAAGTPAYYCRIGDYFQFRPTPAVDTVLTLYYYKEFTAFTADTDTTVLSDIASDLLIYAALSYASDYFMDDRGQAFEGRYEQIKQALQDQAYDLDAGDAAISPPYSTEY